jgi:hypothetical protein
MAVDEAVKRTPGMGTLINALSVDTAIGMRPVPAVSLVGMPRPRVFARLLAAVTVAMIAGLATLMLVLAHAVSGLLSDIRTHEKHIDAPLALALPPVDQLVEDGTFALIVNQFPSETTALYAARAHGLAAAGRYDAAIASFDHARHMAMSALPIAEQVAEADALLHAARHQDAMHLLLGLDFTAMEAGVRGQAVELIGRCHLEDRAAERIDHGGATPSTTRSSP